MGEGKIREKKNERKRMREEAIYKVEDTSWTKGGAQKETKEPVLPWMRQPLEIDSFEDLPLELVPCLDPRLQDALEGMGVKSLFPVQVAAWQQMVGLGSGERDVCICSPTGSGKTLAYALPIVQLLSKQKLKQLRALVVFPTRDLALQVKAVFDCIAPAVRLSVGTAIGQTSIVSETAQFIQSQRDYIDSLVEPVNELSIKESSVDILIATPGRLMDHIKTTKGFTLEHLCYLVVDETDRLLREAYQQWLPNVLHSAHAKGNNFPFTPSNCVSTALWPLTTLRQDGIERGFQCQRFPRVMKMILSATLTQDPSKLSQLELHHPLFLSSSREERRYSIPKQLQLYSLICESRLKPLYLVALLKQLEGEKTVVFTSSVISTHRLSILLKCFDGLDLKISEYSGLQQQSARSKVLGAFRTGDVQVLVASDAMTRGMDVEGVMNVINYDMPAYVKTFVHRAGRTARARHAGRCFTLVRGNEVRRFKRQVAKVSDAQASSWQLPEDSIEELRSQYQEALEKLKETVKSKPTTKKSPAAELVMENRTEEWIEAENETLP